MLRMPRNVSTEKKRKRVEEVLREVFVAFGNHADGLCKGREMWI
jgi:hypothetical protein